MAVRTRDLGMYGNLEHHTHDSVEELIAQLGKAGVHSTLNTALPLDVLSEPRTKRDARTPLLVTFPAAITADRTYPYFSGRGVAASVGMDLLAFSDPALAVSTRFGSNFFMGTSKFDPAPHIETAIRAMVGERPLIFLGSSAGGFPALKFGNLFPDSVTLAINPVTDLMLNDTFLQVGAKITFPRWAYQRISSERQTVVRGAANLVVYAQNLQDQKFIRTHAARYFASLLRDDDQILLLTREWGSGHVPMPTEEIVEALEAIKTKSAPQALKKALRGRIVDGANASAVLADARLSAYRRRKNRKAVAEN